MEAVILHPQNKEQFLAIKAFAKAIKVPFEKEKSDETAYLSSASTNELSLDKSIKQIENGETVKIALEDLWK